jgi:hypothetical protein
MTLLDHVIMVVLSIVIITIIIGSYRYVHLRLRIVRQGDDVLWRPGAGC